MPASKKSSFITFFPGGADFFKKLRWPDEKRQCIRCNSRTIYILGTGRLRCKECGLTFGDFTGTYLGQLNIPITDIAHLLYLFSLGIPVYCCRDYLTISIKTAYKAYTLFRRAIYDHSAQSFFDALDAKPELKESLQSYFSLDFNKPWGSGKKYALFGVIAINGIVYTFPVTDEERTGLNIHKKYVQSISTLLCTVRNFCVVEIPVSGSYLAIPGVMEHKKYHKLTTKVQRFWKYFNDQLRNYQGIGISHYHLYIKDIAYRFNNRGKNLFYPLARMLTRPVKRK